VTPPALPDPPVVRDVVEPVTDALPPVPAPDLPVAPVVEPVERIAPVVEPVTRTVPSSPPASAAPSPRTAPLATAQPASRADTEPTAPAEPASQGGPAPAAQVRSAPAARSGPAVGDGSRDAGRVAGPPRSTTRVAVRPPARRDRRLRRVVAELGGCLHTLGDLQRRVLVLRAGFGAARPHSRRAVAGRLDTSIRRIARAERRGLRELRRSAGAGRCGDAESEAPVTTTGGAPAGAPARVAHREPAGRAARPVSGVREEFRTGGLPEEAPAAILPAPSDPGEPPVVLLLAAAFLAGFAIVWALERRRLSPSRRGPPAARGS
jgi:hypothetical protein